MNFAETKKYMEAIIHNVIPGTANKYEASSDGNIRRVGANKYLSSWDDTHGYRQINICVNGKPKKIKVHKLVAMAFIPNPENKKQVNHKNGNKSDNRVGNLEWATPSENIRHAFRTGLCKSEKPILQYDSNMNLIREYRSIHAAEYEGGFNYRDVHKVLKGKCRKHGGYIWKYKTN